MDVSMSKGAVVDLAIRTWIKRARQSVRSGQLWRDRQAWRAGGHCRAEPLTLADRRIYNLLIANAWERIGEPIIHRISKRP